MKGVERCSIGIDYLVSRPEVDPHELSEEYIRRQLTLLADERMDIMGSIQQERQA